MVTGAGWREEGLSLELRLADGEKELRSLQVGDELAFAINSSRRCIGHRPPGAESLLPCPDEVTGISSTQCPDCFEKALTLPCLRCTGERCRNPARRHSCVQPENHALYLASFAPGVLKVGVARWDRRVERLAEQGARAAIICGRDDGQMVRRAEAQIKRISGIPDRLQTTEKLRHLTVAGDTQKMEEEMIDVLAGLKRRMRAKWIEPERVALPQVEVLPVAPRLLDLKPGVTLRGEIEAISGQVALVRSDANELVAIEAPALAGYELEPLAAHQGSNGQLSLALA